MPVFRPTWLKIADEAAPHTAQESVEYELRLELERAAREVPARRDARAYHNAAYKLGLYIQMRRGVLTRDV